jgi:putative heme-binding domain-containing protein
MLFMKTFVALFLLTIATQAFAAVDPFAELVRPTEALTPAEELAAFVLPRGFEMQLVATEPDLRKPMNMAFDVTGRLWFTESREYPFPAKPGEASRDTIRILSDFDDTGRAKKVTIFAEGLNIPIGLYPFRSLNKDTGKVTWKCIAWSIPNIWLFEDTDGDNKADKKTELYGPLGWEKDTHGNLASFRRGTDGWLYGTHGFNNTSTMHGRDGSKITMQSGNTWRVALDGSRVEQITFGQVNPFGLCFDQRGNMFTADCHSSPIYQLIRGACYPSFGKPHDGLGFAPTTIQHTHGSTALCGIVYLDDLGWGDEYRDNIIVGNVGTSRINRDRIEWRGTTSVGHEQPDFLSTKDPWFRPVDLQIGPDGALYIADFYNKIIGHYEVPLTHPGRDRERGRIWRMVYRGEQGDRKPTSLALPTDVTGLIYELGSDNPTRRTLAMHELADNHAEEVGNVLRAEWTTLPKPIAQGNALMLLQRLGKLDDKVLLEALEHKHEQIRLAALKVAGEQKEWTPELRATVLKSFSNPDYFCRRAAAEALGLHPAEGQIGALLEANASNLDSDTHTRQAIKIAIRNHLRDGKLVAKIDWKNINIGKNPDFLFDIFLATSNPEGVAARLALFKNFTNNPVQFNPIDATIAFKQFPHMYQHADLSLKQDLTMILIKLRKLTSMERDRLLHTILVQEAKANSPYAATLQDLCKVTVERLRDSGSEGILILLNTTKTIPNFITSLSCEKYLHDTALPMEVRVAAAEALLASGHAEDTETVLETLSAPNTPGDMREKLTVAVVQKQDAKTIAPAIQTLRLIPARAQNEVVKVLVGWKEGAAALLTAIDEGKVPAVLLREKAHQDRLRAHKDAGLTKQLDALLAKLPPANVELDKLIAKRKTAATKASGNAELGAAVYKKTCAACHKLGSEGTLVGPQLDGIGGRGLERLLEDVLDPNRNVDRAFRMTIVTKNDGTVTSGLIRKDEGDDLLLVNQQGQEFTIKKSDIDERAEATTSLMPSVAESLPEKDLVDLLAYLLLQKAKQ